MNDIKGYLNVYTNKKSYMNGCIKEPYIFLSYLEPCKIGPVNIYENGGIRKISNLQNYFNANKLYKRDLDGVCRIKNMDRFNKSRNKIYNSRTPTGRQKSNKHILHYFMDPKGSYYLIDKQSYKNIYSQKYIDAIYKHSNQFTTLCNLISAGVNIRLIDKKYPNIPNICNAILYYSDVEYEINNTIILYIILKNMVDNTSIYPW
jgi:hypothetical protein